MERRVAIGLLSLAAFLLLEYLRRRLSSRQAKIPGSQSSSSLQPTTPGSPKGSNPSPRVDALFFKRLRRIFAIAYPKLLGAETILIAIVTVLLITRTRLTVIMANVVGQNAKFLVERDARKFIGGVMDIGLWSVPSAVVNSGIRYVTALLESRYRNNLQTELHKRFMSDCSFFKLANVGSIDNPDHRLTNDLQVFCFEIADLFQTVFKPTMDVITFVANLGVNGGIFPPLLMIAYYIAAGALMRQLMPNFAKLTAQTQQKEGDFRHIHSQIILHAEEVAFYRGERIERENADKYIDTLVKHSLNVKEKKSMTDFMDAVLIKYGATCVGYAVCSIGVFGAASQNTSAAELTRIYIRSSQLYIPLARAIGKLVMLHKRFTALAAYTYRLGELMEALDVIKQARANGEDNGTVEEVPRGDVIEFSHVTIGAPGARDPLIRDLSVRVERGQHLLIRGTNGSGKTSLVRAICGLWPIRSGKIVRPPASDMYVLSQRVFLPAGTMREQLIYPETAEASARKGVKDEELWELIADVGLTNVVQREGGLDMLKDWHEVLSGGERQRVAFIRLLYHRPKFGIVDEATSAVSLEIEPAMYIAARKRGVTLITVSHRQQLLQYHSTLLVLDGQGGYTLSDASAAAAAAPEEGH